MKIETISIAIAVVLSVGGAMAGIDSFYARRAYVDARLTGVEDSYSSMRLNQIDGQIVELERARRHRSLSEIEMQLLARLYRERKQLLCQLRIEKC